MKVAQRSPKVDEYLANSAEFARPILEHLRKILHAHCPELVEEIKWGIPHFDYKGEMMCMFAAYKSHCSFTFWKQSIMTDARLKKNPDLPAAKRFMGKLTSVSDLPPEAELVALLRQAMTLNEQGVKLSPRKPAPLTEIEIPGYFAERLADNSNARAIFESKSDSFRKEYVVWITDAKTESTRNKRIEESLAWIAEGKSRFWKYQK
ncbi:MAG: YdeI/OmpD-associated family protein [Ramlibacter sp.]|nr:YdeI/OmpD-associated family protein [Ramlibacter sp.]MCW5651061.1 YdeI/OmpD-associated family protein [Ramlibacter sp.]